MKADSSKFWEVWGRLVFGGLASLVLLGIIGGIVTGTIPLNLPTIGTFLALGMWSVVFWGVIVFVVAGIPLWLLMKFVRAISTFGKHGA